MKKFALLPIAALAFTAACDDTKSPVAPSDANFELVDPTLRVDATKVNAHLYGSFQVVVPGSAGVIMSGTANFPGNQKNAGTCDAGLWINSQGKRTSGTATKPHPHCISGSTAAVTVILEPISVEWGNPGKSANEFLRFTNGTDNPDAQVKYVGAGSTMGRNSNDDPNGDKTKGEGVIVAYAIDASTLGTTNKRVGTLTIDLTQYGTVEGNLFASDCTVADASFELARCLPPTITADYTPLSAADGGIGTATAAVPGFLYWKSATSPFRY